jgi:uncharacterized NAD(P)/FAD-binding protein YdhS
MASDRHSPVAIVGAGFSGTMVAAHLARRGIESTLIEATDRAGQGAAYSTCDPAHLLNVPAGNMSAWIDDAADFAGRSGDATGFAKRSDFGAYLRGILDQAVASGRVTLVTARAVGVDRRDGRWTVMLDGGAKLTAEALVLATGNQPPGRLPALEGSAERLIGNPWGPQAHAAVADVAGSDAPVLIVGTGLTMVDVVLSLDGAGHRGRIVALSRRGLIPRGHAPYEPAPVDASGIPTASTRSLMGWLRSRARQVGWRAAVDSLRPHSQSLWQALSAPEKRRFLRHARPWWDVHRHRIAPQVASKLADMIAAGRLEVIAGHVIDCRADDDGVEVEFRRRFHAHEHGVRHFAYIFNCTGPLRSIGATDDPLLQSLLDKSLAEPDELGIGLALDQASRVVGSERLWAIGPLAKGQLWEIIAVPDIRGQAAAVAEQIAGEIAQ